MIIEESFISPLCRMVSHFDLHDSACYNVLMSEEWRVQRFAVQQYAFDVFVAFGVVLHHDAECLFTGRLITALSKAGRPIEYTGLPGHT